MHYINNVIRKPKNAERHNDGLNEVLASYHSLELGLSEAAKDTRITADYDHTRYQEAHHRLKCVLEYHLFIMTMYEL